jgi:hydroxyethylthiazole kinase
MPTVNGKLDKLVWQAVRDRRPLTLCLTNFVTVTDCANAILAVGASPVMSLDENDARELAQIASSLVLNIGTAYDAQLATMLGAGRTASGRGIPVVLDPVGAGATRMRMEASRRILEEVGPTIVRGNASEILALAGAIGYVQKGVDSEGDQPEAALLEAAGRLSEKHSCVVAVTGPQDHIVQGNKRSTVYGGSELMARITGTGCMLSAVVGACAGAAPDRPFEAAMAAMKAMKEAGSRAEAALSGPLRLGEYRTRLVDELAEVAVS